MVTVSGSTVTLTLATAVSSGDQVTVDYAKPSGSGVIKDTSGNEAESFSGQQVTNNTAGSLLTVADFADNGLETVVVASFDAGGGTTLYSKSDSRWGESGSLVEGDVNLDADTRIIRVMLPNSDGSLLRLNDNGGLTLRDFFGQTGTGADLTVWVQTSEGTASFAASPVRTAGGDYVNFNVPSGDRSVLTGIGSDDRFLLALTRPAPNTPATGDPTITGTAQVGETLTAVTSAISDAEGLTSVAYTYQWLADDAGITDATASTYTLVDGDVGKKIKVRVSFSDDEGNAEERTSEPTATVPSTDATLSSLTLSDIDFGAFSSGTYSYTASVAYNVSQTTVTPTVNDSGATHVTKLGGVEDADGVISLGVGSNVITVEVTGEDGETTKTYTVTVTRAAASPARAHITVVIADGEDTVYWSDPDSCSSDYNIYLALTPPSNHAETSRTLLGAAASGSTQATLSITSSRGGLIPPNVEVELYCGEFDSSSDQNNLVASTELAYQYSDLRAGTYSSAPLTGLTVSSGTLSPSFNRGKGRYEAAVASDVRRITLSPTVLSGYEVIYFRNPGWGVIFVCDIRGCHYDYGDQRTTGIVMDDADPGTPGFQVDLDGGENRLGLGVNLGDVEAGPGSIYSLTVTVSNVPATGKPAISGTVQVGQTLTAHTSGIADEDGLGNVDFSYQWIRVDEDSTEAEIANATRASYRLVDADGGKTIRVRVDFADDAGNGESLASSPTATVTGATALSADATLSGLALSGVSFGTFAAATTSYTARVNNTVTETTVTPTLKHRGASYVVKIGGTEDSDGTVSLAVGSNAVTVVVTAEDGQTTKTYTVTVSRLDAVSDPISSDALLSGLTLSGIGFGTFQPSTTSYSASVVNSIAQTTVAPTVNDSGASYTIKLNGVTDSDGTLSLRVGNNVIAVEVTAEDESTRQAYIVTVTRADPPSTDATLKSLTINGKEADSLGKPKYWISYWLSFGNDVTEATITPTVNHPGATYVIEVDGVADDDGVIPLPDPAPGEFRSRSRVDVTIVVTAEDGETTQRFNLGLLRASAPTGAPVITGTARVGETLTLDTSGISDPDGLSNPGFEYQWIANDGTTDSDIAGETGATYLVKAGDVGKTIKVRVSFTDDASNPETRTSATTAAVAAAVPGAPGGLTVSVNDTGKLDLSWDAPGSNGGSAITGYKVQWKEAADRWDTAAGVSEATATGATYTVSGLTDGTEYAFRVSAVNSVGDSDTSGEATGTPRETTAPTVSSAAVDGTTLTITFSEGLTESPTPATTTFTVTVGGNDRGVDVVTVSGSTVTLTLATAVSSGDQVTVDYTVPTDQAAARLKDLNDNPAESFSGQQVTNNTVASLPAGSLLTVADFADNGLETVVLASFDSGGDTTFYSAADSRWGESGKLVEGDVDLNENTRIVRVMAPNSDGSLLRLNDNGGLTLRDFFGPSGTGADLTVWVQTSAGKASFPANDIDKVGGNYVNFKVPSDDRSILTGIGSGDRFLLALTRPAPNTPAAGDPTITGTAQVGQTLTAGTNAISDAEGLDNVAYTYQWLADDTEITDAAAYTLVDDDEGKKIKVKVSFSDDEGNAEERTSAETATVAAAPNTPATGDPTITGMAQVGQTLTADTSALADAEGLTNVAYAYQWLADDTGITDATTSSYTLTETEESKAIKVRVSFTDDASNPETLTSAATAAVAAAIPGAPDGLTVSVNDTGKLDLSWDAPGSDGGSAITGYKVQWKETADSWDTAADVSEATATGTTYTVSGLTDGTEYTFRVTAVNSVGDSDASGEATGTPRETTAPTVSSAAVDGATLTITFSEALAETPVPATATFSVTVGEAARGVDSVSISGSVVTLTLNTAVAYGDTVTVGYGVPTDLAAARLKDLNENPAESFSSQQVTNNEEVENSDATGSPTIIGTAQVGETLTVSIAGIADGDGLTNVSYTYQWIANDEISDSDIQDATAGTYTVVPDDVGKTIKVKVSFTDDANNAETLTSPATAAVAAAVAEAPGDLTVSVNGTGKLYLSWDAPGSNGGSAVTGYKVQWKESADSWGTPADVSETTATGTSQTVSGLTDGTEYSFRVLAVNSAGDSDASGEATGTPRETVPPTPSSAIVDGATLTITFSEALGESPVPAITTFTVSVAGSSHGVETVSVLGSVVTLTLETAVAAGDAVTVDYTVPTDQAAVRLTDLNDNPAESFSGQAVTNKTNRLATGKPGVTGTAQVDELLTATTSGIRDADGLENVAFQYRWLADDAEIADATGSTYTPASGDVGKAIKVKVTFTDDAGHAESLTSEAVGPVVAAPSPQPPVATITPGTTPVEEGEAASFTISLDRPAPAALSVSFSVSDPGGVLSGAAPESVAFASGDSSKTVSLGTLDDDVIEPGSTVTASLAAGTGYTLGGTTSASVRTTDNDVATWTVSVEPPEIEEGGSSTFTVAVANGKTFAAEQTIGLAVTGTASGSDYTLSTTELTLDEGATSVAATVTATDDTATEGDETVIVAATHDGQAIGSATVTILANDAPPSRDATLSSLALSGIDIGAFSSESTAYSASVDYGVSSTEVTADPTDDGASATIADANGSTRGTSRTVSLSTGDNEITVTVTAEDEATTKVYTITVARAEPEVDWGERLPDRDIVLGSGALPSGMWSDGDDMWVITNPGTGRIRVYSLADGAEQTARGFTLSGGVDSASALWSDGSTLWVADLNAGAVRAHGLSDGARQADDDLDPAVLAGAGNTLPSGLWSDGSTMWVADYNAMRVFAYDLTSKARRESKEFDLDREPGEPYNPYGIWSNGDTMLVADWIGGEILAHGLSDGQRKPDLDVSTLPSGTYFPTGIWTDGDTLWVSDDFAGTLYAYAVPGLGSTP